MTKSIRSYPRHERAKIRQRRLNNSVKGLGYWAAHDALERERRGEVLDKAKENNDVLD